MSQESLSQTIEIINKLGLHARAAAKLCKIASYYKECSIYINHNEKKVNAKSIMGVLCLSAGKGKHVTIEVSGEKAQEALDALLMLISNRFDESE